MNGNDPTSPRQIFRLRNFDGNVMSVVAEDMCVPCSEIVMAESVHHAPADDCKDKDGNCSVLSIGSWYVPARVEFKALVSSRSSVLASR